MRWLAGKWLDREERLERAMGMSGAASAAFHHRSKRELATMWADAYDAQLKAEGKVSLYEMLINDLPEPTRSIIQRIAVDPYGPLDPPEETH